MWKPTYLDHKLKADEIAAYFLETKDAKKTAEKFNLALGSVYRYLKYKNVKLPERRRDSHGRFTT